MDSTCSSVVLPQPLRPRTTQLTGFDGPVEVVEDGPSVPDAEHAPQLGDDLGHAVRAGRLQQQGERSWCPPGPGGRERGAGFAGEAGGQLAAGCVDVGAAVAADCGVDAASR